MFSDLFEPDELAEFVENFWGKKSLAVEGHKDRWRALPGLEEFSRLLVGDVGSEFWNEGGDRSIGRIPVKASPPNGETFLLYNPAPATLAALYNAGMSLCFPPMCGFGPLQGMREKAERELTMPGKVFVTVYLTPPGSKGVHHYDSQHVFFLQASGEKNWQYSKEPDVPFPACNGALYDDLPEDVVDLFPKPSTKTPETVTTTLKQGDLLYLPPGTSHLQNTQCHSLHYTLSFEPETFWVMAFASFRKLMVDNPEWRKGLRWSGTKLTELDDPEFLRSMQARLEELQAWANGLSATKVVEFYRRVGCHPWPGRPTYRPTGV